MSQTKVLLVGYNGANNTGAEALLMADIEDVRAVLGPQAVITIPCLNPPNLRRYIKEAPNLRIAPLPTIFFSTMRRLVRENGLIMLVEGSTYMDTWSSALLWVYLWTTRCAGAMGKPCLAYAVDAGEIKSAFNRRLVRREASKTSLIITRAAAAAERLRSLGVTAPMEVTADNAFNFRPDPADAGLLSRAWPEAGPNVVGMALVDFYLWPVVMKPWGRKEDCYKWPYYFTHTPERTRATETLARSYAALADEVITRHGKADQQNLSELMMVEPIRVLIVDDQPRARKSLKALLTTWSRVGEMHEAGNGREALQLVKELQPDLVLMDVRMPEIDGLQATVQIKALWPQVKVILLSMYPEYRGEALAAGADAFVSKGDAPDALLGILATIMEGV